nr:helix-turn-helix domain-containing protein [uncultured Microscilla sp.]
MSILLCIDEGLGVLATSRQLRTSAPTVSKWSKRWLVGFESLCAYEAKESPSDSALLVRMLEILSDAPRTGAPARISLSDKEKLVALACQKPKDFGIPLTSWNREMLAKVAVCEGIVEKISGGYVSKILKKSGGSSS